MFCHKSPFKPCIKSVCSLTKRAIINGQCFVQSVYPELDVCLYLLKKRQKVLPQLCVSLFFKNIFLLLPPGWEGHLIESWQFHFGPRVKLIISVHLFPESKLRGRQLAQAVKILNGFFFHIEACRLNLSSLLKCQVHTCASYYISVAHCHWEKMFKY